MDGERIKQSHGNIENKYLKHFQGIGPMLNVESLSSPEAEHNHF